MLFRSCPLCIHAAATAPLGIECNLRSLRLDTKQQSGVTQYRARHPLSH